MIEPKSVMRKILLGQLPSGEAALHVGCPLHEMVLELDRCLSCEFYRGLSFEEATCRLNCRYPGHFVREAAARLA